MWLSAPRPFLSTLSKSLKTGSNCLLKCRLNKFLKQLGTIVSSKQKSIPSSNHYCLSFEGLRWDGASPCWHWVRPWKGHHSVTELTCWAFLKLDPSHCRSVTQCNTLLWGVGYKYSSELQDDTLLSTAETEAFHNHGYSQACLVAFLNKHLLVFNNLVFAIVPINIQEFTNKWTRILWKLSENSLHGEK